jgi:type II secretory pathway pseudopilin PulG
MRRGLVILGLTAAVALPLIARSQSLTDVARAEEARRKAVKKPAKVYTNDDLKPSNDPVPAPGSAAPATVPDASARVSSPTPAPEDPTKTEKFWRERMTTARETLDRSKVLADALQSRINALTTDFVNTDDPAKRSVVEGNRKTALAELDRLHKDIETQTKAIADIREEARKASVPAGWLR